MNPVSRPEDCAGAPGTIRLGNKTYLVSAASDEGMMIVLRYLRRHIPTPLDMYDKVSSHPVWSRLPAETQARIAGEAADKAMAGDRDASPEVYADLLMQAPHCRFLAWVLLQEHAQGLQLADLDPLITEDTAPVVFLQLQRESGMEGMGKRLSQSGSPAAPTDGSSTDSSSESRSAGTPSA